MYCIPLLFTWLFALQRWAVFISFATGAFTMIDKRPNAGTKLGNPVFIILAHGARIGTYWVLPKDEGPYSHVTSAPALAAGQMQ